MLGARAELKMADLLRPLLPAWAFGPCGSTLRRAVSRLSSAKPASRSGLSLPEQRLPVSGPPLPDHRSRPASSMPRRLAPRIRSAPDSPPRAVSRTGADHRPSPVFRVAAGTPGGSSRLAPGRDLSIPAVQRSPQFTARRLASAERPVPSAPRRHQLLSLPPSDQRFGSASSRLAHCSVDLLEPHSSCA